MSKGAPSRDAQQARIDDQASEWIVLLDEREPTAAEQSELDRWLAADPRHRDAWQEMSRTWATIPALNGIARLDALEEMPTQRRWSWMRVPRLAVGAFAAMAAASVLFFALAPLLFGPKVYQTGVGQMQSLTLEDGSQVTLGPRSSLTTRLGDAERRITLLHGEAFFEVAHEEARAFFIEAGGSTTRVVGTKLDVNYAAGSVRVAVLEGLVQVSWPERDPDKKRPAVAYLKAGQRAEILLSTGPGSDAAVAANIVRLSASAPGAWREGRLVYEDSRLSDVVSDMNRYYAPGVTVADEAILHLRVTASFKASEIPAFLASVGAILPVKATETADGAYRLEAANP